jgi:two-component system phosphate regulon sensor histidine kinase PhoR
MRPGIRARFLLLTIALLVTSFAVFGAYVVSTLDDRLSAQTVRDLDVRAALTLERARAAGDLGAEAQVIAEVQAKIAEARVTIIDPSGAVRGDSDVPAAALSSLPNHAERPEIIEAKERGVGRRERYSTTLHDRLLYVALRLDRPDGPWVVRLAATPVAVDQLLSDVRKNLLFGTLLALATATALAFVAAGVFTRSIRHLTATARKMQTDLSMRTRLRGEDDISRLGMALDELAAELERSLGDLSQQREKLEAMLDAMQEGVLVTDDDGSITVANRALRRMLLAGDLIGRQPIEALRNAELHDLLTLAMETRKPVSRELDFGRIRRRRARVQVSPLSGEKSRGVVAVFFDVTDLRRLETMRRDFVANVSHELRTPIASIRATSETLRGGALDEPETAREFVEIIDRNAQRLHRLVEDLLDLSKIEAKELDLRVEALDARASAEAAALLIRPAAEQKKTTLSVDAPEGLRLRTDARALEQILTNLIDNAVKYCPPGARVTVKAREATPETGRERVIFEVIDDGPGIDAAHLPRLFERFYRVDTGRSRALGGTGLGLAIVKHLAEALGGQVSVESSLGRGSVFRVDLPA